MEELYKENSKIVYFFLYSQCHDTNLAEELTQETFLQAYKSLERFDGSCKLSVWLCQIAKHLLYQYLRKAGKELTTDDESISLQMAQGKSAEELTLKRLELMDILKEMQKLPQLMREVIYLRVMGELSFKEIGEVLGKTENWARVNFYRGKEQLLAKHKEWR